MDFTGKSELKDALSHDHAKNIVGVDDEELLLALEFIKTYRYMLSMEQREALKEMKRSLYNER